MNKYNYEFYIDCCNYYSKFIEQNPEFNNPGFKDYVICYNKGDRDSGELAEIVKHEILRLAYEYEEREWRFLQKDEEEEKCQETQ